MSEQHRNALKELAKLIRDLGGEEPDVNEITMELSIESCRFVDAIKAALEDHLPPGWSI